MSKTRAFRRCHICGSCIEDAQAPRRCSKCGKAFAPFYYYDDRGSPVYAAGGLRPPDLDGQWRPIKGLTAYWQSD